MKTREMKSTNLLCREISLIRDRKDKESMKIQVVKRINTIAEIQVKNVEESGLGFEYEIEQKKQIEERRLQAIEENK